MDGVIERLWSRSERDPICGCWLWVGNTHQGYGRITIAGLNRSIHRLAYTVLRGEIPAGLTLDHLCRRRNCWNPEHLEPVTRRENVLRGVGPAVINGRKTHCDSGHEFTEANTLLRPRRGGVERECRTCSRERMRRLRAKRRFGENKA